VSAKKARDLADGDLIDIKQHPAFARFDGWTRDVADYEYARVGDEDGPHVWEPDGTFLLCTTQGVFVTDPDTVFDIEGIDR
jgi:hypothetical protein